MKKFTGILTVSLVAIMAVGAARADLAATTYVDDKVTAATAKMENTDNKVKSTASFNDDIESTVKYPSMAVARAIVDQSLETITGNIQSAQDAADEANTKISDMDLAAQTGNGVIKTVTQTDGKVTATRAEIVNADIATNAAIAKGKLASDVQTSLGLADSALQSADLDDYQTKEQAYAAYDSKGAAAAAQTAAITAAKTETATQVNALATGAVKTNTDAISAITNATTGILAQAKADAASKASAAQTAAIAAAKTAGDVAYAAKSTESVANTASTNAQNALTNIGTLSTLTTTAKTNTVAAINEVNAAVKQVTTDLSGYATDKELEDGLAAKQNNLTTDQLAAANSGITSAKVSTYDGYNAKITANATGITEAKAAASAAQTTADRAVVANTAITAGTGTKITYDAKGLVTKSEKLTAADIPTLTASKISDLGALAKAAPGACANATNKCVLTFNGTTYAWEVIGR